MKTTEIQRDKLLQTLITKLTQVLKVIHSRNSFPFGDFTLNRQQIMILFFISEKREGAIVKDLAKFLRVTPGAITQFVNILIKYKLVKRQTVPSDHRSSKITLSSLAQKRFKEFKKNYFIFVSQAFKKLSTKELQQFINLTKKVNFKE